MGTENPRYGGWYSGITNNEKRRKAEHAYNKGIIKFWKCLDADNFENANKIEAYFSSKGTKNSPYGHGAKSESKWVYIFKIPTKKPIGLKGPFVEENILKQIFGE